MPHESLGAHVYPGAQSASTRQPAGMQRLPAPDSLRPPYVEPAQLHTPPPPQSESVRHWSGPHCPSRQLFGAAPGVSELHSESSLHATPPPECEGHTVSSGRCCAFAQAGTPGTTISGPPSPADARVAVAPPQARGPTAKRQRQAREARRMSHRPARAAPAPESAFFAGYAPRFPNPPTAGGSTWRASVGPYPSAAAPANRGCSECPAAPTSQRILLIGAGPIVIGQACEFDYSGTQGAKALREEGYDVVLVNSNPATIMTDPELAARTYVEPLEWRTVAAIIERERPHAILPTLGGQTALNLAMKLARTRACSSASASRCSARSPSRSPRPRTARSSRRRWRRSASPARAPGVAHSVEEAWARREGHGLPGHPAPELHARRLGRRHRLHEGGVRREGRAGRSRSRRRTRCSSRRASSGGRSSSSRSCATARTTSSSSARSRTSTRWACTPATRSPSRRR